MKTIFTFSFSLFVSIWLLGQNVTIPDANFKANLVGNPTLNTNSDTEIQVAEAQVFTGSILCEGWSISDLTGIEAFTSLTELNCTNNALTSIDLSANTMLTTLTCASNQLSNLDVSANTLLTNLNCSDNLLTGLDVSLNTQLTYLSCYSNSITSIDLSQNTALTHFWCMFNPLIDLDVSLNTNLTFLQANNCSLASLNLANGNNVNFVAAKANNNGNLSCIKVDNAAFSIANWTSSDFDKDPGTSYSEVCAGPAGLNDIKQNNVSIYPNPCYEELKVLTEKSMAIEIHDVYGNLIQELNLNAGNNTVDISGLAAGVYFLANPTGTKSKFIKN